MSSGVFAKEADWWANRPVAELTANGDVVSSQEKLLVATINLLSPFHEVVHTLLVANVRRYNVVVALLGLLQQVLACEVSLEADLGGVKSHEVDLFTDLDDSHAPIKSGLILAKRARFRCVNDAAFDSQGLQPAVIEVGRVLP